MAKDTQNEQEKLAPDLLAKLREAEKNDPWRMEQMRQAAIKGDVIGQDAKRYEDTYLGPDRTDQSQTAHEKHALTAFNLNRLAIREGERAQFFSYPLFEAVGFDKVTDQKQQRLLVEQLYSDVKNHPDYKSALEEHGKKSLEENLKTYPLSDLITDKDGEHSTEYLVVKDVLRATGIAHEDNAAFAKQHPDQVNSEKYAAMLKDETMGEQSLTQFFAEMKQHGESKANDGKVDQNVLDFIQHWKTDLAKDPDLLLELSHHKDELHQKGVDIEMPNVPDLLSGKVMTK